MFKNLHYLKSRLTAQPRKFMQSTKRFVSGRNIKPPTGSTNYLAYGMAGAGVAGLAYLMYKARSINAMRYSMPLAQQKTFFDPFVQQRVR